MEQEVTEHYKLGDDRVTFFERRLGKNREAFMAVGFKEKAKKAFFLSDLSAGQSAVITGFSLPDEVLLKLMEMGVGVGRVIRFIRKAPLGGPLEVEVLQYHLAIRQSEAKGVEVRIGASGKTKPKRDARKGLKGRKQKI